MLRLLLGVVVLVLVVAAQVGCAQPTALEPGSEDPSKADKEAIRALPGAEFEAVEKGDIEAHLAVLADDVVTMPPNEAAIYGKPAFGSWSERFYSQFTIERFDHSQEQIVVAGDWAFEDWTVSMTVAPKGDGDAVSEEVKGIHIYHKQSDGSWRIVRDIWNSDNPVPGLEGQ